MLEHLLSLLEIKGAVYTVKNTKKDFLEFSEDGKFLLIPVGCTSDRWSSQSPTLVISKSEVKRSLKLSTKRVVKAYKELLGGFHDDLRSARFTSYEMSILERGELLSIEAGENIVAIFNELVKVKGAANRKAFLETK